MHTCRCGLAKKMKGNLTLRDPTNMAMRIHSFQTSECWSDCGQDFWKGFHDFSADFTKLFKSLLGSSVIVRQVLDTVKPDLCSWTAPCCSLPELPAAVIFQCQNFTCFFNRSNLDMVPKARSARFHGSVCAFPPLINARKQAGTDRPQRPVAAEKSLLALLLHDWTLLTAYRMGNQSTFLHHQCTRPNI